MKNRSVKQEQLKKVPQLQQPTCLSRYLIHYTYFYRKEGLIQEDSLLYHIYASITEVVVDKGDNRVILTYNIDYPIKGFSLSELLEFVYMRILKMDMGRRYCKYYAPTLSSLIRTEASINFIINGDPCDFDIPNICLEDKYSLVEESIEDLLASKPQLKIESIENKLQEIVNQKNEEV